ncbi:E3 ubiquitin-protein ligase RNF13-like [Drosophila nasuta]|uniref:E3 ubiquitin-protein ligase RNF13-like n=1 Tax=Drosophila nasuta TaxID=42062 RepID=UPI00295F4C39|nr:E3 ubiquitin-protein ligase RNF13-like [Drosophila nasuta]
MSARRSSSSGSNNIICQVRCGICLEHYTATDIVLAAKCGHLVHGTCLNEWQKQSRDCPICRKRNDDYFQIYLDMDATPSPSSRTQSYRQSQGQGQRQSQSLHQVPSSHNRRQTQCHHHNQCQPRFRFPDSDDDEDEHHSYENMILQQTLFRSEIEYLNTRFRNFTSMFDDSD